MTTQTKTTWRKMKLGDFAKVNPSVQLQRGKNYPFLDMADVQPLSRMINWPKIKVFNGSGARFENRDTLFARITPCLENGKITQALNLDSGGFGSTEFYIMRGKDRVSDSDFIHYLSRTYRIRKLAEQSMIGASGRQRVERAAFENIEVEVPEDINYQKRIVDVLSAFDDKIELNNKISRTLEQMAQAIFKEWFTAPSEALAKDSELPKGWKVGSLFEVADVAYGFPFKSSLFNQAKNGMPLIRIRNLADSKTDTFTTEATDEKYEVKDGDILVGMDGEFYIRKWSGGLAYLNQRVARLRPKSGISWYQLFLSIIEPIRQYQSSVGGTTVAHLSDKDLRGIRVLLPNENVSGKMKDLFDPLYWRGVSLQKENQKLAALRDLFLPKLMSGEVRV